MDAADSPPQRSMIDKPAVKPDYEGVTALSTKDNQGRSRAIRNGYSFIFQVGSVELSG